MTQKAIEMHAHKLSMGLQKLKFDKIMSMLYKNKIIIIVFCVHLVMTDTS